MRFIEDAVERSVAYQDIHALLMPDLQSREESVFHHARTEFIVPFALKIGSEGKPKEGNPLKFSKAMVEMMGKDPVLVQAFLDRLSGEEVVIAGAEVEGEIPNPGLPFLAMIADPSLLKGFFDGDIAFRYVGQDVARVHDEIHTLQRKLGKGPMCIRKM